MNLIKNGILVIIVLLVYGVLFAFADEGADKTSVPPYKNVNPNDAPENIRNAVMSGYDILMNTQRYFGGNLSCGNCHFLGGFTKGGKGGGISLLGVAAVYPRRSSGEAKIIDLPTAVRNCFSKSLNISPPPAEDRQMQSIIAYLHWISHDIPIYSKVPWLGLPPVSLPQNPDAQNGGKVYLTNCAKCHSKDGSGNKTAPPLWGPNSYTNASPLNNHISAFILFNMPKGNAKLSQQQAQDVSSFIMSQSRPLWGGK
ncbi:MAG: c-type cytochrome [Nitrospirae bacterium]|nr:c-type cytochrome [Nitrospirota bacterium]